MDAPVTLIVALVTLLMIVVLATAAQRLLGVRFGVIRTFLAALPAFVLAGPLLSPRHLRQARAGAVHQA
jgi:ubiquinone biosynthesis protein